MGGVGPYCSGNGLGLSQLLQELVGLVRIALGVGDIGRNCFGIGLKVKILLRIPPGVERVATTIGLFPRMACGIVFISWFGLHHCLVISLSLD